MQPVRNDHFQYQTSADMGRFAATGEPKTGSAGTPPGKKMPSLPTDVVSLTVDRTSALESITQKPSIPVTASEKTALRESFSTYA